MKSETPGARLGMTPCCSLGVCVCVCVCVCASLSSGLFTVGHVRGSADGVCVCVCVFVCIDVHRHLRYKQIPLRQKAI